MKLAIASTNMQKHDIKGTVNLNEMFEVIYLIIKNSDIYADINN